MGGERLMSISVSVSAIVLSEHNETGWIACRC
jgi:hypothetical protein